VDKRFYPGDGAFQGDKVTRSHAPQLKAKQKQKKAEMSRRNVVPSKPQDLFVRLEAPRRFF